VKKVKNNKRYDTDSATKCGGKGTIFLYRKRTGEFFLADFAADAVTPLTYERAHEWVIQNGITGTDKFFQFKPGKTVTSFSLSHMTVDQLKRVAQARGEQASQVIADLVYEAYSKL
jgi:hypothetical protein